MATTKSAAALQRPFLVVAVWSLLNISLVLGDCNVPKVKLLPDEKGADFLADKAACFANLPTINTKRGPKQGQRINFTYCEEPDFLCNEGGYKYKLDEVRVSGAALAERGQRLVLFRASTVQMCMFGRLDTGYLRSKNLTFSVHGNIEHLLSSLIDPAVPFCDIGVDVCKGKGSTCDRLEATPAVQNFCGCTTIKVPNVPTDEKIFVKTTLKVLDFARIGAPVTPEDVDTCEKRFDIDDLKSKSNKNTLACIRIPSILGRARKNIQK